MSCKHHPSAETLLLSASGKLNSAHQLMLDMHLRVCSHCAQAHAELESLGGVLLDNMQEAPLKNLTFERLMSAINQDDVQSPIEGFLVDQADIVERILMKSDMTRLNWHWRTKRFAEIPLAVNDENIECKLIYFKKGMKVPRHTHNGDEKTLVLHGAFSDESGVYNRGDYISRSAAHEHSPYAESDCICLTITDAPLKFTGTFGPLLNVFLN